MNAQKLIIGLTGTHGAGKGTVVEYLVSQGFGHFSARALLRAEIEKRKLPLERPSFHRVANELRETRGPEYVAFSLYEQAALHPAHSVIESIYTIGEICSIRTAAMAAGNRFSLWAVDADQKIRYDRITGRQSETDRVSFEKFCEQEAMELTSDDPHKHNLVACRGEANMTLLNNGTVTNLHNNILTALYEINS